MLPRPIKKRVKKGLKTKPLKKAIFTSVLFTCPASTFHVSTGGFCEDNNTFNDE